ncbi:MAG: hypothetical protein JSW64_16075 [Candidatus Zixiibacteriota bacterium]|nr:MAG: hypothetical protein JSW64_16075 [candidate division Zixibacteria bacterium]
MQTNSDYYDYVDGKVRKNGLISVYDGSRNVIGGREFVRRVVKGKAVGKKIRLWTTKGMKSIVNEP